MRPSFVDMRGANSNFCGEHNPQVSEERCHIWCVCKYSGDRFRMYEGLDVCRDLKLLHVHNVETQMDSFVQLVFHQPGESFSGSPFQDPLTGRSSIDWCSHFPTN